MKTLAEQMSVYQRSHTKELSKMAHSVGAPCVVFALLMVLSWVHVSVDNLFSTNLAWIGVVCLLIYYLILDFILALATAVILLPLTYLAQLVAQGKINTLGVFVFLVFFIGGLIMQFLGHYLERKKIPAFLSEPFQIIMAPIFLMAEAFFAVGYRKKLQTRVNELAVTSLNTSDTD